MLKRNKIALSLFVVFYISFGAYLTIFQERIVYLPGYQDFLDCENFRDADKVTWQGTRMYVANLDRPTVVLYHGNAGSACDRFFYADIFTRAGYGYIIVTYAGYSNDTRRPSHELIKQDVRAVISFVNENKIPYLVVVGESIGTGVASYHASVQAPDRLLLITPFTSLAAVARERFWFYPTSLLVDNAFDNVALLSQYQNPVRIIHGDNDFVIPYRLGRDLYNSLPNTQKEFITIAGAGHNDLFLRTETYEAITSFLRSNY